MTPPRPVPKGEEILPVVRPRSVEEWVFACAQASHFQIEMGEWGTSNLLCSQCARAYAAEQVAQARAEERETLRLAREALMRIAEGEESVKGLRPEFYGHATKIAMDAIAEIDAFAAIRRRGEGNG